MPSIIYLLMGIVSALLLFICLILHELSHSVVARTNELPIAGITLFVFGGVAHMEKEPQSPKVEFKMAIAGPLMSIALSLFFLLLSYVFKFLSFVPVAIAITDYLSFFNIAIAIFNIVPAFPLDGGRVFRAVLWHFLKSQKKATRIAAGLGKIFASLLMGLGFLGLITGSIVSGVWFIFLGFFLLEAADLSYRSLVMKRAFSGIKVKDIMSANVISVPSGISIKNLIDTYFFKYRHNCFPVIKDGALLGIVTFHDTKDVPKEEWDNKTVNDILIKLESNMIINEEKAIEEALTELAHNDIGRLLVVEDEKLVGIISHKDIIRLFKYKEEADRS
ncbi:site-2 protease family protein [Candidatus Saganbacteria bacterium]|nr:site-2 protease family protein [Candidatus Saganbacteria bacterium]